MKLNASPRIDLKHKATGYVDGIHEIEHVISCGDDLDIIFIPVSF